MHPCTQSVTTLVLRGFSPHTHLRQALEEDMGQRGWLLSLNNALVNTHNYAN